MKPVFEEPMVDVIELNDKDIVCASGCTMGVGPNETEEDIIP